MIVETAHSVNWNLSRKLFAKLRKIRFICHKQDCANNTMRTGGNRKMHTHALWLLAILGLSACASQVESSQNFANSSQQVSRYTPSPYVQVEHPSWAKDAVIYQINTRQFTPEGTFNAAREQLPRLKRLGVDILWLMPIHPIGETNRKGPLGSPYAVKDYFGVNPEFGTEDDFRAFVDAAHAEGFKVILDWVANHTAWDLSLIHI